MSDRRARGTDVSWEVNRRHPGLADGSSTARSVKSSDGELDCEARIYVNSNVPVDGNSDDCTPDGRRSVHNPLEVCCGIERRDEVATNLSCLIDGVLR